MSEPKSLSHNAIVRRIGHWLRHSKGCNIVLLELKTANHEIPDALGFHGSGESILVECKASRSDFLADKQKIFRQMPAQGMGDLRFFAGPPEVFRDDDITDGWGILKIHDKHISLAKAPEAQPSNKRAEVKMLMSAIRRLEISSAVFVMPEIGDSI